MVILSIPQAYPQTWHLLYKRNVRVTQKAGCSVTAKSELPTCSESREAWDPAALRAHSGLHPSGQAGERTHGCDRGPSLLRTTGSKNVGAGLGLLGRLGAGTGWKAVPGNTCSASLSPEGAGLGNGRGEDNRQSLGMISPLMFGFSY